MAKPGLPPALRPSGPGAVHNLSTCQFPATRFPRTVREGVGCPTGKRAPDRTLELEAYLGLARPRRRRVPPARPATLGSRRWLWPTPRSSMAAMRFSFSTGRSLAGNAASSTMLAFLGNSTLSSCIASSLETILERRPLAGEDLDEVAPPSRCHERFEADRRIGRHQQVVDEVGEASLVFQVADEGEVAHYHWTRVGAGRFLQPRSGRPVVLSGPRSAGRSARG